MFIATASINGSTGIYLIEPETNCARAIAGYQSVRQFIRDYPDGRIPIDKLVERDRGRSLGDLVFHAPLDNPQKIFCVGRNYIEHAEELGNTVQELPVIFNKLPSALIGNHEAIKIPEVSDQVDFEAELVVVIGLEGFRISRENAQSHIFGFTCGNDVTARDWQKGKPGGQWLLGKSCDTFAPLGPWIATKDAFNPKQADISLRLNGELMQQSNTAKMIFDIAYLISHLSKFTTLKPGDLIFTGTPSGVGAGRDPQVFLKPGDHLEVEIGGIGTLKNPVIGSC